MATVVQMVLEKWGGDEGRCALEGDVTPSAGADAHVRMSYSELRQLAVRLAQVLHEHGYERECVVGMAVSGWSVALAVLGIWCSGAAFAALDASWPADRLRTAMRDALAGSYTAVCRLGRNHVVLVVQSTASAIRAALPAEQYDLLQIDTWALDALASIRRSYSAAAQTGEASTGAGPWDWPHAEKLAYVIFTSGSLGRPKAVLLTHAGLPGLVVAQREAFAVDDRARVLQFYPAVFDAFLSELCVALCSGATCVWDSRAALDALTVLRERRITHACLPPALLAALPPPPPGGLPALRTLVVGGEAMPAAAAAQWSRVVRLVNAYGPTEASVCATCQRCDQALPPVLGRPFPHIGAAVRHPHTGERVPDGQPGELCLSGPALARGYAGDAARTALCFVPDPDGPPGTRLYRTGDLVRREADTGRLVFLGRLDAQVQVRGYRVELAEVEQALCGAPGVRVGAVVPTTRGGTTELFAFAEMDTVGDDDSGPGAGGGPSAAAPVADAVRQHLRRVLPAHCVPRDLVRVPPGSLPRLTASGKLDRVALTAQAARALAAEEPTGGSAAVVASPSAAPQEAAAAALLRLLREVAGVHGPLTSETRLDALRLSSLDAVRLAVAVQRHTGRSVPAHAFLGSATVQSIVSARARVIAALQTTGSDARSLHLEPVLGDLTDPDHRWGVAPADWARCVQSDPPCAVLHCAGAVNLLASDAALFAANVRAVATAAEAACAAGAVPLHVVSSLSALVCSADDVDGGGGHTGDDAAAAAAAAASDTPDVRCYGRAAAAAPAASVPRLCSAYARSKRAAEREAALAAQAGAAVTVYRPAMLSCTADGARVVGDDYLAQWLRLCGGLQAVPDWPAAATDLTPVDAAAGCIARHVWHSMQCGDDSPLPPLPPLRFVNIANGASVTAPVRMADMAAALRVPLRPAAEWLHRAEQVLRAPTAPAAVPDRLRPLLEAFVTADEPWIRAAMFPARRLACVAGLQAWTAEPVPPPVALLQHVVRHVCDPERTAHDDR